MNAVNREVVRSEFSLLVGELGSPPVILGLMRGMTCLEGYGAVHVHSVCLV